MGISLQNNKIMIINSVTYYVPYFSLLPVFHFITKKIMIAMKIMHNTATTANRTIKVTVVPFTSLSSSSSVAPTLAGAIFEKRIQLKLYSRNDI